jgi:hypothetical protein
MNYHNHKDWEKQNETWAANRTSSAIKAVELKIEETLNDFVSPTGRWDLESFRLVLAGYKAVRELANRQRLAPMNM